MFGKLAERVNADAALVRRGSGFSGTVLLACDGEPWYVSIAAGRIASAARGARLMQPYAFAIRASGEAWRRFAAAVPEPGYHDIFAMAKRGEAAIEGDITGLMRHLRYFKDVLAALRDDG